MPRIRRLSETLANQIAAGEVVERPASVVKELLENAIDAGARRVEVRLEGGGKDLIAVADDGHGIDRDDVALAFERHATSKIETASDLHKIATLGFRGEALPSIASVSRFVLTTLALADRDGTRVRIGGGKIEDLAPCASDRGTAIEVRDLFFNVPARLKFLKSTAAETAAVTAVVTRAALAHPGIHFTLTVAQKTRLSCPAVGSERARIGQLFDVDRAERLLESRKVDGGVALYALVDPPRHHFATRLEQYVFVNRRPVVDRALLNAVSRAYDGLVPGGRFPSAFLFLDVDPAIVDVNVHPAKTEVRFIDARAVHALVTAALREALAQTAYVPSLRVSGHESRVREAVETFLVEQGEAGLKPASRTFLIGRAGGGQAKDRTARGSAPSLSQPPTGSARLATSDPCADAPAPMAEAGLRVLGQFRGTFIVAIDEQGLLLADQHTAHERVLFEELDRRRKSGGGDAPAQRLLIPQVVEVAASDAATLEVAIADLSPLGIELEAMDGSSFAVRALPVGVAPARAAELVRSCLEAIREGDDATGLERRRHRLLATVACHAAVKVNMPLDKPKLEWILRELLKCGDPYQCPHGRATLLRFDEEQIKRSFGRYW